MKPTKENLQKSLVQIGWGMAYDIAQSAGNVEHFGRHDVLRSVINFRLNLKWCREFGTEKVFLKRAKAGCKSASKSCLEIAKLIAESRGYPSVQPRK